MPINRKELKLQARLTMHNAVPSFWKISAVFLLLTFVLSSIVYAVMLPPLAEHYYIHGRLDLLFPYVLLLLLLYRRVMHFSFGQWALRASRDQPVSYRVLTKGFDIAGRVIIMNLLIFLRLFLGIFLLSLCVCGAMAVMIDPTHPTPLELFFVFICVAAAYAVIIYIFLRYAFAPYLLADHPGDGARAVVRRSAEMMRGHKWELFQLYLSFLGWYLIKFLLAILVTLPFMFHIAQIYGNMDLSTPIATAHVMTASMPIAVAVSLATLPLSMWLTPYVRLTVAGFYLSVLEPPVNPNPNRP